MNEQALNNFIKENARPVELAMYRYFFENGTSEEVIKELLKYQNPDGGFGHGLEADFWNPASSPIATNDAIIRLNRVKALDREAQIVKDIIRFLKSGDSFDKEKKKWLFAINSSKDYPHAIWWEKEPGSDGISDFNPTVSLAAFIVCYGEDDGYYADIVREAFEFLTNSQELGGDSIKCFLLAYDMLVHNGINNLVDLKAIKETLQRLMLGEICKDVSKYGVEYATMPSDFFADDIRDFVTPEFEKLIAGEIENLNRIQLEDGGFDIYWQWYTEYKEFEQARKMWRPRVSLERLLFWNRVKKLEE